VPTSLLTADPVEVGAVLALVFDALALAPDVPVLFEPEADPDD
jgi:hypothetical protein